MTARLPILLIASLTAALVGFGCGGDDGGDSASGAGPAPTALATSSLSKAQYVKRANAICHRERGDILERINAYARRQASLGRSEAEMVDGVIKDVFLPTVEKQIVALRELGAPAGDEERIESILAKQERVVGELAAMRDFESTIDAERRFAGVGKTMAGYGIFACSNSSRFDEGES